MRDYLVFRLYGPMSSWGDIAVGEIRHTYPYPSKSAILGLIGAALGIKRSDEELQLTLSQAYGLAVQVDDPGIPLTDYHTIQAPSSGTGHSRKHFATRRDEVKAISKENAILSRRDYRMDALYIVAVWSNANPPFSLQQILDKLNQPVFVLYLGRKSCPIALPLESQIIKAASIAEALNHAKFLDLIEMTVFKEKAKEGQPIIYWEECEHSGIDPQEVFERRDAVLSRERWQFDIRKEYSASFPKR